MLRDKKLRDKNKKLKIKGNKRKKGRDNKKLRDKSNKD